MSLIDNKKAFFNYETIDTMEVGIELFGFEVKSLRAHRGTFDGSHVLVKNNEAFLIKLFIPPYQPKNTPPDYNPERPRRLLVHKKDLEYIIKSLDEKGLTVVPLSLYSKGRFIKVNIAIMKGKKLHDKRQSIKKRDTDREMRRIIKGN